MTLPQNEQTPEWGDRSRTLGGPEHRRFGADEPVREPAEHQSLSGLDAASGFTLELREEQLIAHKELQELGNVQIRTHIAEVPGRLEVDAYREEIEMEHRPVGEVVTERREPWEEGDVLVVPIYEERLVVVKRLVLREQLRVRRVGVNERQLFEQTLRRETATVEDPQNTGLIHEIYPDERVGETTTGAEGNRDSERPKEGFLESLGRKVLL